MALTESQRAICRLIASNRIEAGESYVAGASALNELIGADRVSRDIDLFHDTEEAVEAAWRADRSLLESAGYEVRVVRERRSFVEAEIRAEGEAILMQWARDSAYRFFPLIEHDELGLTLHPLDLATNKVLALIGRLQVRDWIDVIECDSRLQPLGFLAWAASGKDPGFSPTAILEQAARTGRYTQEEVAELSFGGSVPDAGELSRRWHEILDNARRVVAELPPEEAGKCVLERSVGLYTGRPADLAEDLRNGRIAFHTGRIRGALPQIVP